MREVKGNKFIVYATSTAAGVDFADEKTYDPRGYVPKPNIKLLLISDEELAQNKRVPKETKNRLKSKLVVSLY